MEGGSPDQVVAQISEGCSSDGGHRAKGSALVRALPATTVKAAGLRITLILKTLDRLENRASVGGLAEFRHFRVKLGVRHR